MAIVAIASPSLTHKGVSGFTELRASAVLTTGYVASDSYPCGPFSSVVFDLDFTIGSLTSLEVKVQYSTDGGTTWRDVLVVETPSSGVSSTVVHVLQMAATTGGSVTVDTTAFELVRLAAKGTGTVTGSLLAIGAAGGKVAMLR